MGLFLLFKFLFDLPYMEPQSLRNIMAITFLVVAIVGGMLMKRHLGKYLLIVIPLCLVIAVILPSTVGSKSTMQRNYCVANQKQMAGALAKWAAIHGKSAGERVALSDIASLLKGGKILECPAGGTYLLSRVGKPVECSLPAHAYPKN
jgi:hypothetical protein